LRHVIRETCAHQSRLVRVEFPPTRCDLVATAAQAGQLPTQAVADLSGKYTVHDIPDYAIPGEPSDDRRHSVEVTHVSRIADRLELVLSGYS
jgi:hypothetical protein